MNNSFLNELVTKRNDIYLKKNIKEVNPKNTLKFGSKKDEYINIESDNFDILNNILKKNNIIENNTKLILFNNNNNTEYLIKLEKLLNNNYSDNFLKIEKLINKNNIYLCIFNFIILISLLSINNYLLLEIFT